MAKPVYALVGSDSFLQLQALSAVLAECPKGVSRIDVAGESASLADVLDELRSYAMFGGGKVVLVRDADAFITRFREQLEDYVAAPADANTLVLRLNSLPANQRIYKAIAKTGQIVACEPPKDLGRWIVDRGKTAHKLAVSPDAASLMAELIGSDLGRIDNELAKLALTIDGTRVGPQEVAGSVAFQRERQMWDLTNALAGGDPAEALRRWRQLVQMDSSAEFRAVTWLGLWLENVRKAIEMSAKGMNAATIGQTLRIWPREGQQPFVENAKRLGPAGVVRAVDLLAEIDHQSKSGVGDAAENVERFLLTLAAAGASR